MLGMGFAKDWTVLVALRLILGIFEAGKYIDVVGIIGMAADFPRLLSWCCLPDEHLLYKIRRGKEICFLLYHWCKYMLAYMDLRR